VKQAGQARMSCTREKNLRKEKKRSRAGWQGQGGLHAGEKESGGGPLQIRPEEVFKLENGFLLSCFDSISNPFRILTNSTRTLKLKHSINPKQNASGMKMQQTIFINPKLI
jgi:hypothetical protein